jgi:hypothetical protein
MLLQLSLARSNGRALVLIVADASLVVGCGLASLVSGGKAIVMKASLRGTVAILLVGALAIAGSGGLCAR